SSPRRRLSPRPLTRSASKWPTPGRKSRICPGSRMLNRHARGFFTGLFSPLARFLLKVGVSPDAVTVVGTAGVVLGALSLYHLGQLWWGSLLIAVFALSDVVDGIMAREQGRSGPWGNFLDSTLDRLADGAIFAGVA